MSFYRRVCHCGVPDDCLWLLPLCYFPILTLPPPPHDAPSRLLTVTLTVLSYGRLYERGCDAKRGGEGCEQRVGLRVVFQ